MRTSTRADPAADRVGQEHDGRLEPLGLVQVHHPDDVAAPGLERQRFDLAAASRSRFQRLGGIGQAAALLDDLAHAIDGVQQVAGFGAAGRRRGQRQVAGGLEDAVEAAARAARASSGRSGAGRASALARPAPRHLGQVGAR